jgi:ABC-2 type transport system ATP-binding protein
MNPVVETHQLTRHFANVTAVQKLSMQIHAGEVFGFLGHNGAGKTTTIRMLNGVLTPTSGSARVLGHFPTLDGRAVRQKTGVLTETPALDERLTGFNNLVIYGRLFAVENPQKRAAELLERFDLTELAHEKAHTYSKGMKQRLALARTLLHEPELLFLDEPTTGLDPVATQQVHEMIITMSRQEKRTVFLCTHNLVEAQRLCDRIGIMEHGRLIALGRTAELAQSIGLRVRLEIETAPDDTKEAERHLKMCFSEIDIETDGNVLVVGGVPQQQIPDMITQLVNNHIRLYRVQPQTASLEDVYFAMHRTERHG